MEQKSILSVGIDIGTTTTQLVFSSLALRNTAGPTQAPRYSITDRRIVYESPVVFTPKIRPPRKNTGASDPQTGPDSAAAPQPLPDRLDEIALNALVRSWYADAGYSLADVVTGAVIVTGESLKTPNARRAVMNLSDSLGDFVVAAAGPHLESIIAGRGAGAGVLSLRNKSTVLNIDIGGGTANYAVFHMGDAVDTACLNVGGRLIETTPQGEVVHVHPPAEKILEDLFGRIPQPLLPEHLRTVARRMADLLYDLAVGLPCPLGRALLQTPPLGRDRAHTYDAVTLSGGVGACCRDVRGGLFRYGDMGPLLAEAILEHSGLRGLPLVEPAATVRATVIGAGSWSLSLSGSTVWAEDKAFPLRNVPVVTVPLDWNSLPGDLEAYLHERLLRHDLRADSALFALAFEAVPTTYAAVCYLARGLARFFAVLPCSDFPVILALREDLGKALGMELRPDLPGRTLVVVDEVRLREGDYLDLGKPLESGAFVPLVIKSLAFSAEN